MAVTKINVQSQLALSWKVPVRTVSGPSINLSSYDSSSQNGVTLASGERLLVINQNGDNSAAPTHGIYQCNGAGQPFSRSLDCDTSDDVKCGMLIYVEEGDKAGSLWYLQTANPIVLDTTALLFVSGRLSIGTGTITSAELGEDSVQGSELDQRKESRTGSTSTAWSLSATPFDDDHLEVFKNGQLLVVTADYTRSGADLTMIDPIVSGDVLVAIYTV